mgnify:CR=1 FL=1
MSNKVAFNKDYPNIEKSEEIFKRSQGLIPSHTQTLAKGPSQFTRGVAPIYLEKGKGCHVWDVDGNEYLDYVMGVGPLSLGYNYPKVNDAIKKQLDKGIVFSLVNPLEVEVSELIKEVIPNAESVRISKTGADVTSAAIRAARAYTGRTKVLGCGYHGWHDWYISVTDRNKGIPEGIKQLSFTINYNDIESLEKSLDADIACVIMEPTVFDPPKPGYLEKVKELCEKNGTVLIFDEMWTGFRLALGGAQEYFGVTPDLATYSKACANGMPVAFITGKKEIMQVFENDVFFYTTFGGEALSLAACKATIEVMKEKKVQEYLFAKGKVLKQGILDLIKKHDISYLNLIGFEPRTLLIIDGSAGNVLEIKSLMQQEMIKRGILWAGYHNISFSHTDKDIDYTLKVYDEVLPIVKKAVADGNVREQLKGEPVSAVFKRVGQPKVN